MAARSKRARPARNHRSGRHNDPTRKLVAYRLPIELLDAIAAVAAERGVTATALVEETMRREVERA